MRQIPMRVMRTEQEQTDRDREQEFLGGRILVPVVDLLPHVEIVIGASVELEGHAAHPVEHEKRAEHVGYVCEGPGQLLADARQDVVEDFKEDDQYRVDYPSSCLG